MGEQRSAEGRKGILFVVATPIGNLEDLTFRALRTLNEADIIACEDTRQTLKLLTRYKIRKRLISYFQPREGQRIPLIIRLLEEGGNVALVSDAGTPGVSDPGYRLIQEALRMGIKVVPIPGPSALVAALSAAGLPTHRVLFLGFPPPKKEKMRKLLQSLKEEEATLVFHLPTRKIADFLLAVEDILGPRQAVIAREMTKVHEEFLRGEVAELRRKAASISLKGEATVLVQGRSRKEKQQAANARPEYS